MQFSRQFFKDVALKVMITFFLLFFTLCVQSASHHPQDFLTAIKGKPDEGSQIVQHFCATCHAEKPLISLNAPVIGNEKDWELRIKKGLPQLILHLSEGFGAMPARGGCFECSDKQLELALFALLPSALIDKIIDKDHK